jgi:hypothetical protein
VAAYHRAVRAQVVLGAVVVAAGLAGWVVGLPPRVAAPRANLQRLATAVVVERARPTATPYPTPAAVPRPLQSRAEVLARAAGPRGRARIDRVEAKLMRLGDWERVGCCGRGPGMHPELWLWVVAWWGDGFEPPFGPSLAGVPYTWEATAQDALGGSYGASLNRPFPPPVWEDLPDYSRWAGGGR